MIKNPKVEINLQQCSYIIKIMSKYHKQRLDQLEQKLQHPISRLKQVKTSNTMRYRPIYSSRSQTVHRNTVQRVLPEKLSNYSKTPLIRTIKTNKASQISFHSTISNSIKVIQDHKLNTQISIIKKQARQVLQDNSRQNRMKLVDILQQLHPFFNKIHRNIAQAIIILSKPALYYNGQLIFDRQQIQSQTFDKSNKNVRSKQDIGFMIYGKLQLANDRVFYSYLMKNYGTLFQSKFLGRKDKTQYYANVLADTLIFWLSKQSYYIIRKECFLSLDLKYMFGEFQNMLKLNMVQKKLGPPLISKN